MWIIFEGLDKAGKGTLEREFLKATDYKHIVIDRGPIGYKIFDKVFGRDTKISVQEWIHQARKITKNKDFFIVYCHCSVEEAKKRLKKHKEECPYDYERTQKMLRDEIGRFYNKDKVLNLDTTGKSVEECVEIIVQKIKEVQKSG